MPNFSSSSSFVILRYSADGGSFIESTIDFLLRCLTDFGCGIGLYLYRLFYAFGRRDYAVVFPLYGKIDKTVLLRVAFSCFSANLVRCSYAVGIIFTLATDIFDIFKAFGGEKGR